jgi:NAD(P)-dependent dehydrogenase (short-subunit alcohol dehydrogenase family)
VLAARNAERLESLAAACRAAGAEVPTVPGDLTEPAQCQALVEATLARFGRLDTLVANAGRTMWAPVEAIRDPAVFRDVMELNYFSVVWLTLAALPSPEGRARPDRPGGQRRRPDRRAVTQRLLRQQARRGRLLRLAAHRTRRQRRHRHHHLPDFVVSEIHRRALDGEAGRSA